MSSLAIITGASKGIGKATAIEFIKNGWIVINLSRTSCEIEGVVNFILNLQNLSVQNDLAAQLECYLKASEKITLVHNACHYISGDTLSIDINDFKTSLHANIVATVMLEKMVIPSMNAGSSIIYVGSTLSEKAVANCMPYVVNKHAQIGLMRSNCQDFSRLGIHACCVCPGFTETETLKIHLDSGQRTVGDVTQHVAMKKLIQPAEMANFIYYCATNPILNGSVLHANLGFINY